MLLVCLLTYLLPFLFVQSGVVPDESRRLQMLRLVRDELSADLEDSDLDASLNASGHSLMRSRPKSGQVRPHLHLLLLS